MPKAQEIRRIAVALRKESVDRNLFEAGVVLATPVALRKESVDRNLIVQCEECGAIKSLSARRAWIEIHWHGDDKEQGISRSPQGERG